MESEIQIKWRKLGLPEKDNKWDSVRCLYAYLAPYDDEILYIGKSWSVTVIKRWEREAKKHFWDDLEKFRQIKRHRVILGEVYLEDNRRLTKELLSDTESLLIYTIKPWGNINSTNSIFYSRPGTVIKCVGSWPLSKKTYRNI